MTDRTVSFELSEAAAQAVLGAVERDPNLDKWGQNSVLRNEAVSSLRSALQPGLSDVHADAEETSSEDDVADEPEAQVSSEPEAPAEEPAGEDESPADDSGSEEVPATPSEDGESESDEADRS